MRHSLSLPTVKYICMRELPHFHHGPTSSLPLSRHSVDLSPRAFHSSTHTVVRASCFEVVSASVESIMLFWMEACAWQGVGHGLGTSIWMQRSASLTAFRRVWGGAICLVCVEWPHEEQANSAVEKQSTNTVDRTVGG